MYRKAKAIRRFLWVLVAGAALGVSLGAGLGESSKGNDKVKKVLPGSNISIEEAYTNATAVIEGVVIDEGVISPGPPGEVCYERVKLKVTQGYKGAFKTNETVTVNVFVRTLPASTAETAPKKDDTLIFFIGTKDGKADRVNKTLPATREARDTIGAVTQNEKGK
jgi:hypothetical protein